MRAHALTIWAAARERAVDELSSRAARLSGASRIVSRNRASLGSRRAGTASMCSRVAFMARSVSIATARARSSRAARSATWMSGYRRQIAS